MTEFDQLSGPGRSFPTSLGQSEGLTEPFNRHSSLKSNNCNALSPARQGLTRLPRPLGQGDGLAGPVSVARVRPRTSKGITDLLLPQTSIDLSR
ncbi:hypothetical protein TEQG_08557 [Trichophyton equinum CBS 127.97]|uniref:Uncharacterized protein n=1 Tax=Trichophyton equinum (strain ATCC MYA-4606 / CBS 127.97) TaxID=559882 RepID=F2Q651_TRIEC|nr:hypothetical protein TEQG_08557 [Trichophyton equinum CBS 127.97]